MVFAHVVYERQTQLKAEIIRDTLGRIGHVWLPAPPVVVASPEHGYRMRARLHARGRRLGFLREGTHQLCDAGMTGQLMPETLAWVAEAERVIAQECLVGLSGVEVAENVRGDETGLPPPSGSGNRPGAVCQACGRRPTNRTLGGTG